MLSNPVFFLFFQRCRVCTECGIQGLMLPGSSQWFDNYSVCEACQCQRSSVCGVCSKPTSPTMALQCCSICHRSVKCTGNKTVIGCHGGPYVECLFFPKQNLIIVAGGSMASVRQRRSCQKPSARACFARSSSLSFNKTQPKLKPGREVRRVKDGLIWQR